MSLNDTIKLSDAWDLTLDNLGNIAVEKTSAAISQDVASAVLTYQGEVWYDTTAGLPYFAVILGKPLNAPLFASLYNAAALTVPGTVQAQTTFDALTPERKLVGTVKVTDTEGQSLNATF